jgi:hypothetical protein
MSESRAAFRELIALLSEVESRYLGEEWSAEAFGDLPDGFRSVMNTLEGALYLMFDSDAERPIFRPIVTRTRKMLGDNPDALYLTAPVRDDLAYRVTGSTDNSPYYSFTVETNTGDGGYSDATSGVLRHVDFDVAPDGRFEVFFGGEPRDRNWMALPRGASELIVRCYFEEAIPVGRDPNAYGRIPIVIENLADPGPPTPWDDDSVAAGIRRVGNFVRSRTLEQAKPGEREQPTWVSVTPNHFHPPETPGDMAFSAFDAAYTMAPYLLAPDEALVLTGRWPTCAFGNVSIWNRYLQTYDYAHRSAGRNRANTTLEPDGSFRIVIAHADPGVPNWIDAEGRPFGMVFWRFFLPEGDIETPVARLVPLADVRGGVA